MQISSFRTFLWDQYQSEDSVSRPVPGRPRTTAPAEDRFLALSARRKNHYCAAARCRPLFKHQEEESPLLRCEIVFTMQVCMQEDQLCAFPSTDDSEGTAYAGKRTCFLDAATMGFCAVHRRVPDLQWSDSGRLLIWRDSALDTHQSNTVERHSYRRWWNPGFWAGISLGGTLTCMCSMEEP
ncbi:transposable element Tcb2 transposase [Trichonephila clavipes]|nr:transposable element Tcb2 transposase [Trichonephila clavipes]